MTYTPFRPDDYQKLPVSWQGKFGRWGDRLINVNKFGYNPVVGTSYEDIWSPGGSISFLAAADVMDVVSSSIADDVGSTGATSIRIEGLDGNYNFLTEDVLMDGQTPVTTTNSFLRVYRAYVLTAGTGGVNAGDITITDDGGSSTQSEIEADRGQSLMAIYTVREGYYGLITKLNYSVGGADSAEIELRVRLENGVSRIKQIENIGAGGSITTDFGVIGSPILVDPKSDVLIRAKKTGAGGSTTVSASFTIWEVREEEIRT